MKSKESTLGRKKEREREKEGGVREARGKEGRNRLAVEEIENEGKNEGIARTPGGTALKQNGAITTATKGT